MLKKVSIPYAAVMLGLAALGNLLQSYGAGLRYFCGACSLVFLILLLGKLFTHPQDIRNDLKNPVLASVSSTFPMGLMILSTYLAPFVFPLAFAIWGFAVVLYIVLIQYFTKTFILKFDTKKVFASYFVLYCGLVVASVTAPVYGMQALGTAIVYYGLACFAVLFFVVSYRYIKYPVPEPAKPVICIYTAPLSLCIAGYISTVEQKSLPFTVAMLVFATVLYVFAFVKFVQYIKLPFYPSFGAYTFPFVISAIAMKQTLAMSVKMEQPLTILPLFVTIETVIATILVFYTMVRFLMDLTGNKKV